MISYSIIQLHQKSDKLRIKIVCIFIYILFFNFFQFPKKVSLEKHVTPLFKKGDRACPSNYYTCIPVSLASHIIKIYEGLLRKKIVPVFGINWSPTSAPANWSTRSAYACCACSTVWSFRPFHASHLALPTKSIIEGLLVLTAPIVDCLKRAYICSLISLPAKLR